MAEATGDEPEAASPVEPTPAAAPAEPAPTEPAPAPAKPEPAPAPAEPARPSNLGIWAFALALLGLIGLLPIIGSVLGFVLGRVAIRRVDSRRVRGGRGLAVAAVTISVITLVLIALAVAAYALALAYLPA